MLKKINRGLGRKDFEESRKSGRMIQTPLFGVSVIKSSPPIEVGDPSLTRRIEQSQFGFIVSKKISKKAVERNKIRRRLAEVIQSSNFNLESSNIKIVFLVRKNILEAKLSEISDCWRVVYEKLVTESSKVL